MAAYNILDARNNLSRIIASVESGAEEAIIMRRGKAVAKIVPVDTAHGAEVQDQKNALAAFFATYTPPPGGRTDQEIEAGIRELREAGE